MSRTTTPPVRRSFDAVEGSRYERHNVSVRRPDGSIIGAITYVAKATDRQQGIHTSFAYVQDIIRGLRESGADPEYIEEIKRAASENSPAIATDVARL